MSEWMGYGLFFEDMINSVVEARKSWLKEGGLMFPQVARLYLATARNVKLEEENVGFWEDVYGWDMGCCKEEMMTEIHSLDCSGSEVIDEVMVFEMDIGKVRAEIFRWRGLRGRSILRRSSG